MALDSAQRWQAYVHGHTWLLWWPLKGRAGHDSSGCVCVATVEDMAM